MDASRQTAPTPDPDDGLPVLIVDDQAPFRSAARAVVRRMAVANSSTPAMVSFSR